jgi:hypothetical protein
MIGPFAYNEAAIFGTVWEKVDQALKASEARAFRVLVLVGPRFVCREIRAIAKTVIDGVKGDNEILGTIRGGKCTDNPWLGSDFPDKVLVRGAIVEKHSLFVYDR